MNFRDNVPNSCNTKMETISQCCHYVRYTSTVEARCTTSFNIWTVHRVHFVCTLYGRKVLAALVVVALNNEHLRYIVCLEPIFNSKRIKRYQFWKEKTWYQKSCFIKDNIFKIRLNTSLELFFKRHNKSSLKTISKFRVSY